MDQDKEYLRLLKLASSNDFIVDSHFGVIDINGALNFVRLDFLPVPFNMLQDGLEEL